MIVVNSSQLLFPCSCHNISHNSGNFSDSGFCEAKTPDWPVYDVVNGVFRSHTCCLLDAFPVNKVLVLIRDVPPAWRHGSSPTLGLC